LRHTLVDDFVAELACCAFNRRSAPTLIIVVLKYFAELNTIAEQSVVAVSVRIARRWKRLSHAVFITAITWSGVAVVALFTRINKSITTASCRLVTGISNIIADFSR
jgi:hypothetical protein